MIAYKYAYSHAHEDDDNILVEINVDKELIDVMMKAVIAEISTTADILTDSALNEDEVNDCIFHIRDMIGSYIQLRQGLEDIAEWSQTNLQILDDE